jgi:hypothetical protein
MNLSNLLRTSWHAGLAFGLFSVLGLSGATIACGDDGAKASASGKIAFNRDIRPILAENCFSCHGPDSAARKADLRLDKREMAVESGAIVPGKADESELIRRIFSTDPDEAMPPAGSHKTLKPQQKELLKKWIASGAEYQLHWSFIAPTRPQPPVVKNEKWVRNPIDRFILARLEEQGLQPAPEADRRTLARRLSLDMTGLPPAPAEVEAFVNDTSPDAYEKLIDRLQASPHWGEHRGRYWLDAARYADTHGIHFDNYREIWSYRDWVIGAFNRNLPFDEFTIEQLAGDLLPNRTLEQHIASGFNRCNITTNEGGIIDEEYIVLYARDRTETTSQVWLGLTTGCAVCHDHKFDPVSQREFYELSAFFNNTTQGAKDGNIKDTPPTIVVPKMEDRPRWETLTKDTDAAKQLVEARKKAARGEFDIWLKEATPESEQVKTLAATIPNNELRLHAALNEGEGNEVQVSVDGKPQAAKAEKEIGWMPGHVGDKAFKTQDGGMVQVADTCDFDREQAFSYGVWVKGVKKDTGGALVAHMDDKDHSRGWDLWLDAGKPTVHLVHKWQDDAIKVVAKTPLKHTQWSHLFVTYDGSSKAAGVKIYVDGELQVVTAAVDKLKGTIRTDKPVSIGQRLTGSRLDDVLLQDLRVYSRVLPAKEVSQLMKATRATWLVSKPADKRTPPEANEVFDFWLQTLDKPYQELAAKQAELEKQQAEIKERGTVALVMTERPQPATAYILHRGEYDKRRDQVNAGTPSVLPPMPADAPKNRLSLAQWLLRPEQPMTARVTVNRFWQELYGNGLVRTSGDFGITGEQPSHPELLDWLAVEFRESGWDMKKFFKLLVTSAAYRQAPTVTPEKLEKDSQNRLLSRGPRFRMDAEMIRDYALASSGLLVPKLGGASVKPYQPDGVWEAVAMIGSNTRDYKRDTGESLYRRSMYTFWKRAAPPATMDVFNAPNRETCAVRRERTNTPLQALVTLNDPQYVEAARHLAQKTLLTGGETTEKRIDFIARRLLARPLIAEEAETVMASLNDLLTYYREHSQDAQSLVTVGESKADSSLDISVLAAWTMLVNELMNLDEVLNK